MNNTRPSWQKIALKELCEFKNGLWKGKKEPYINVGVIRNTNFTKEGLLNDEKIAFLDVEVKQYSTRKLEYGDLILEKSGGGPKQPVGRVIPFEKVSGEYSFSNFTSIIRISDKDKLDHKYLHRFLHFCYISGKTEAMQKHSTGIRNLQLKEYKEVKLPLPPLPEQQRIVSILDEAFTAIDQAIANTEKNLANARELFESYLNNVFTQKGEGWVDAILSDICEVKDGTHDSPKYKDSGIPFVTQKNVREDGLNFINTKYISNEDHEKFYKRSNVSIGDILISMIGANRGMSCLVDDNRVFSIKNVGLIKKCEDVDMSYLLYYLKSAIALNYIESESRGGAQPFIGLTKLRLFPILLAPLKAQIELVIHLDKLRHEINQLSSICNKKIESLTELKQSLLQKAFSGELTSEDIKQQVNG